MAAAEYGIEKIIKLLLIHGADPKIAQVNGQTPLSYIAQYGQHAQYPEEQEIVNRRNIINFLLKYGTDINFCDKRNGETGLFRAGLFGCYLTVQLLLSKGANVNILNFDNQTVLMHMIEGFDLDYEQATRENILKIFTLLIESGISLDAQDKKGRTAIMIATKNGFKEIVKFLLDKGARTDLKNNQIKTAYDIAIENGYSDIASWIRAYDVLMFK